MSETRPTARKAFAQGAQVERGARVWVGGHNLPAKRAVAACLRETVRPRRGPVDHAFIAPCSVAEATYFAKKLRPRLSGNGVLWVVYPNPGSVTVSGLEGTEAELNARVRAAGFEGPKRFALTEDYMVSRFDAVTTASS